eukprot:SAG22_NODE_1569_length_4097_cov_2.299400_5_plen_161_part_01
MKSQPEPLAPSRDGPRTEPLARRRPPRRAAPAMKPTAVRGIVNSRLQPDGTIEYKVRYQNQSAPGAVPDVWVSQGSVDQKFITKYIQKRQARQREQGGVAAIRQLPPHAGGPQLPAASPSAPGGALNTAQGAGNAPPATVLAGAAKKAAKQAQPTKKRRPA